MRTTLRITCAVAGGLFLLSSLTAAGVEAGVDWEWRSRVPQGNTLYDVTYSGGQFVGVGGSGAIITSPDGIAWAVRASGTSATLRGVAGSGSVYVAVGENGTILSSYDGHTWAAQSGGAALNLTDIAWSGSEFVARGRRWTGGAIHRRCNLDPARLGMGTGPQRDCLGRQWIPGGRGATAMHTCRRMVLPGCMRIPRDRSIPCRAQPGRVASMCSWAMAATFTPPRTERAGPSKPRARGRNCWMSLPAAARWWWSAPVSSGFPRTG